MARGSILCSLILIYNLYDRVIWHEIMDLLVAGLAGALVTYVRDTGSLSHGPSATGIPGSDQGW